MTKENLSANPEGNSNPDPIDQNSSKEGGAIDNSGNSDNNNSNAGDPSIEAQADNNKVNDGVLGGDSDESKKQIPADWPADWREKYAGQDEKALNQLKRFASPKAALDALFAAQKKISSTRPQIELPQNPTQEDIANYRKAYNIPENPEGYDIRLDGGLVIGEHDKPIVDEYLKAAHERNFKPEEVKKSLQAYFEIQQKDQESVNQRIKEQFNKAEDELRGEWGTEYRANKNRIDNFLENNFGKDVADALTNAVLGDGTMLKYNSNVLRKFLAIANEVDPASTITGNNNGGQGLEQEISSIENIMRTNPDKYYSENMAKRLAELYTARDKISKRAA